jgi:hypothetical protein
LRHIEARVERRVAKTRSCETVEAQMRTRLAHLASVSRALAAMVAIASEASAERFTLAAPHPFSFAGITGTLLPVTFEESEGNRICVSLSCTDPYAGDQIFFRISLAAGSQPLHALALAGNLTGSGGRGAYVASGEAPIPTSAITFGSAPGFVFSDSGTLDANETTPVLLNVYPTTRSARCSTPARSSTCAAWPRPYRCR